MKKNAQKKLVLCCISIVMVLGICSPFLVSYYYLPSDIKLIAGQEHEYNFEIPFKAVIDVGDALELKHKDEIVQSKSRISLNAPIQLRMEESGKTDVNLSILGRIPLKTVSVEAVEPREVIPGGELVGVKVVSEGICVIGTGAFEVDDEEVNPCEDILQKGDIITSVNGKVMTSKEEFKEVIQEYGEDSLLLEIVRQGETKEVEVTPVYSEEDGEYKIGAWIKDGVQGIGTLTYVEEQTGHFGALGHGITDNDVKGLVPIKEGEITTSYITEIKKGEKGQPGELSGVIESGECNILGDVLYNTPLGIYGTMYPEGNAHTNKQVIPIAFQDEVREGEAIILAELTDEGVKSYDVMIQKVSRYSTEPTKGMVLKITDPELLELTNGIVQGMSGSPIIQDDKLIGAITHVFVQDPTKGYGIFIENMIQN